MQNVFNRTDRLGLIANGAAALLIVLVLNLLIFGLGWQANSQDAPGFLPPPIVIGIVWCVLFPCMGFARWELNRAAGGRIEKAGVFGIFVLCATYPFYTGGLNSDLIGEAANVTILVLTGALVARCLQWAPRAAAWLTPLGLWLSFASVAGAFTLAGAR